jgi:hypothetical protein
MSGQGKPSTIESAVAAGREWQRALAKIREGIEDLFERGEDEERVRALVSSQLRQVLDDRDEP